MNKGRSRIEERVKRVQDGVQPVAATRRMAVKEEVQVGCRGVSRIQKFEKQRSSSWDFDQKAVVSRTRVALRDVDPQLQQQPSGRKSTPRASSVNTKRAGSLPANEKSILSKVSSPVVHSTSHLAPGSKRSPALQVYRDEVPLKTVSSATRTGISRGTGNNNKTVVVDSPVQPGVGRRVLGEKLVVGKASPLCARSVKAAKPSPAVQRTSKMSLDSEKLSVKVGTADEQAEGLSSIQSSLHGRLSMLEGRVSQMAAELRQTKELLDSNNPICSKVLLTDIHSKIINIERCMTGSPVGCTLSSGGVDSANLRQRIHLEQEGFKKALQSLTSEQRHDLLDAEHIPERTFSRRYARDSPAVETKLRSSYETGSRLGNTISLNFSKMRDFPALDHSRVELVTHDNAQPIIEGDCYREGLIQTGKRAKSRPSLHQKLVESRATLSEKLKENRELLRIKLADLAGRDREETGACDEGALVAAEFLTSLDGDRWKELSKSSEQLHVSWIDRKSSLPSTELSGAKDLISPSTESTILQGPTEHSSSNGSLLSSVRHRYSDAASDSSNSEHSSPSYFQSAGDTTDNQRSSISMGGDFADINHLKLSDGNQFSRQLPLAETARQPINLRSSEGDGNGDGFSIFDLRCDESVLAEDEEDEDFSNLNSYKSPADKDEDVLNDSAGKQLIQLGKRTTTAGWFACEGEGILLAHEDGCCSYYDVANMEEKAEYIGPSTLASRVWGDCWIIRAAGTDGRSNKYVVAASAGGAIDSAFCSWDFYSRNIAAYHCESPSLPTPSEGRGAGSSMHEQGASSRRDLSGAGSNLAVKKWFDKSSTFNLSRFGGNAANKKTFERSMSLDNVSRKRQVTAEADSKPRDPPLWWYRPCGALLASAASGLTTVSLYDVRDGDTVMLWEAPKAVAAMSYSSPLQWRNKGKLVLAEVECLSFWDVESLEARRLHTVILLEKQMCALHVYNVDAECSGGVRQRLSSSDHHSDGILCTNEAVNVLDFRVPTGIAKKFSTLGEETQSIFADGDAVYSGATSFKTRVQGDGSTKVMQPQCRVNQWSIRQGKLMNVYSLPQSNSHSSHLSITQVWGSSDTIMAANGNGLFVFDAARRHSSGQEIENVRDVLGSDDLDSPTFDFASSRVLLISRDRPAVWCHWP